MEEIILKMESEEKNLNKRVDIKRDSYLDFLKGILIILVCFGHCIQYGSGREYFINETYFDNIIFKIIYSFHMPLFMAVSGLLLGNSYKRYSTKELVSRRLLSILLPIFAWNTVSFICESVFSHAKVNSGLIFEYIKFLLRNIWFLWAVAIWTSFVITINTIIHRRAIVYSIYFVVFIALFFIPEPEYIHWVAEYKFMFTFFIIGYEISPYYFGNKISLPRLVIVFCGALWGVLLIFYNRDSYIYTTGYLLLSGGKVNSSQLIIDLYRWIVAIIGSLFVAVILRWIYNSIGFRGGTLNKNILCELGKASMAIYIVSERFLNPLLLNVTDKMKIHSLIVNIIETIIVIIFSYAIYFLLRKNALLRKGFLGGR